VGDAEVDRPVADVEIAPIDHARGSGPRVDEYVPSIEVAVDQGLVGRNCPPLDAFEHPFERLGRVSLEQSELLELAQARARLGNARLEVDST
jgi:hypothetical protein